MKKVQSQATGCGWCFKFPHCSNTAGWLNEAIWPAKSRASYTQGFSFKTCARRNGCGTDG